MGFSGRIQTHLAGGGRASARGSRDTLPLVHLPDKMPGPPAPRWALPCLLPGALSPRTRPSGALHPLAGAPRPPTPRPRSLGRPPYFRLVARGRRHRSEATGLAGPAALKLQLPAGSTQARMRAAGRWRVPRVRERGGACAGVRATLALRMRAVGCRSERERGGQSSSRCEGCGGGVGFIAFCRHLRAAASPGGPSLGSPHVSVVGSR